MTIRASYKYNGKGSDVPVARFSVDNAPGLGAEERRRIATWLREQAKKLVKDGTYYSETKFCARYLLPPVVVRRLHRTYVSPSGARSIRRRTTSSRSE